MRSRHWPTLAWQQSSAKNSSDCGARTDTFKLERDILSRATAWFALETRVLPSGSSGS